MDTKGSNKLSGGHALAASAWLMYALVFVWPLIALVSRAVSQGVPPANGFAISSRQLGLLSRSFWLAAGGTVLCVLLSLPGAFVVGRVRGFGRQPLVLAVFLVVLVSPPTICAFGWGKILGPTFDPLLRCMLVWAFWAWPIPAAILGVGWSSRGRQAFEAALLSASPIRAFGLVVCPLLMRHILLSAVIVFLVMFGDYGVPHACGLRVFATELLSWASSSSHVIDTAWPAVPAVGVTLLGVFAVMALWSRLNSGGESSPTPRSDVRPRWTHRLSLLVLLGVAFLLPLGGLAFGAASPGALAEGFRVYHHDLAWSLATATAAGAAATFIAIGITSGQRLRRGALIGGLCFGALPGPLIGQAIVAAYNNTALGWVYDSEIIVVIGYVARFGWVALLAALLLTDLEHENVIGQAQLDGASSGDILRHITLPMRGALLGTSGLVVMAFSLAELPTTALLRVPWFAPISQLLVEKFHRFEDEMMISLSLWLVVASLLPCGLLMLPLRKRL